MAQRLAARRDARRQAQEEDSFIRETSGVMSDTSSRTNTPTLPVRQHLARLFCNVRIMCVINNTYHDYSGKVCGCIDNTVQYVYSRSYE